jgi:hypothetical protein
MNRIQELSRRIARGELELSPETPLARGPRRWRALQPQTSPQPSAKPSRNSATFRPRDSIA